MALEPYLALLYPAAGPVLLCYAIRAWGRHARRGGALWFLAGLALATVGLDAILLLKERVGESPNHGATWPLLLAVAAAAVWVGRLEWRSLSRSTPALASAPPDA